VRSRRFMVIGGVFCFSVAIVFAADTPRSAHANIVNAQGTQIGTATLVPTTDGVAISVRVSRLPGGKHGIHIHTVGKCEGPDFESAGGHFNPTNAHHGVNSTLEPHPHVGDLMNLIVGSDGVARVRLVAHGATLGDGPNSLFHDGGTSFVIHAKPDDLMSDPTGNSGDRIACGVIER
jgi:superoxide dismutase, Cu-Zn family